MRVINFNSSSQCILFILFVSTLLTACSSSSEVNSLTTNHSSDKKASAKLTKPVAKALKHTHESNPCTAALVHSHLYETDNHEHSYDCENTNEFVGNAHVHPAIKGIRKYRHVHPNGANKHSHNSQ